MYDPEYMTLDVCEYMRYSLEFNWTSLFYGACHDSMYIALGLYELVRPSLEVNWMLLR